MVDDVVAPSAIRNDREERFPSEALDGLRSTGYIGLTIPEEYGGGGADPLAYTLLIEELRRADANVRSIVSVHLGWLPARSPGGQPRAAGALAAFDGDRRVLGCFD
jgi:alkylation response protein AidB-like acyl-CoA dehydrogenase